MFPDSEGRISPPVGNTPFPIAPQRSALRWDHTAFLLFIPSARSLWVVPSDSLGGAGPSMTAIARSWIKCRMPNASPPANYDNTVIVFSLFFHTSNVTLRPVVESPDNRMPSLLAEATGVVRIAAG
jgi:hypothetical protein